MKPDITIYLLVHVPDVESSVEDHLLDLDYEEAPLLQGTQLPEPMRLFFKHHRPQRVPWVTWASQVFDDSRIDAPVAVSGAILVRSAGRLFVATFGSAWAGVDPSLIERDFGLRVAMQIVEPDKLQSVITRSLVLGSSETNIYNHQGRDIAHFSLDPDADWLRQTGGSVAPGQGFLSVRGTDSVRLSKYEATVLGLPATCAILLTHYQRAVPNAFAFYDQIRPIPKRSADHPRLESALLTKFANLDMTDMTVVLPRHLADPGNDFELKLGRRGQQLPEVSDVNVHAAMRTLSLSGLPFEPDRLRLVVTAPNGTRLGNAKLTEYVECELHDAGGAHLRYALRVVGFGCRATTSP